MKRGANSIAKQKLATKMKALVSSVLILTTNGSNQGKAGFFVNALLDTLTALNKVHQFKVWIDAFDGVGVGITDNVVSIFIFAEVNGKAIGFIGSLVSPIVSSDCGLRSGEWLRE
ncbi:hypothetical protein CMI47_04960 [Candidatus Pacearchaeota archaeon]|nr:hypothetical protein [Candidatus Pacearchaeota archaeon]